MHPLSATYLFLVIRFSMLMPLMLFGCGGDGSSGSTKSNPSSTIVATSSISTMSAPSVSSNPSSAQTPLTSSKAAISSSASSHENQGQLIDVSHQFSNSISEHFYVFSNPAEPQHLHYLPKQLALTGSPGIASIQRTNKISVLQKMFFDLSDTDWTSANQITFSSRYTLDVDLQKLHQESEAIGYNQLVDIKVASPVMNLEQRYTTSVPPARIKIQCKNLTLLINGNDITLHDCNLADSGGIVVAQPINHISNFRYETLNFDADAISGNKSLRGTVSIDYTLPGTREVDRLLSTNNGGLQNTWQVYFTWPLAQTVVNSATVTVNWKTLLTDFKAQVSAGKHSWDNEAINAFTITAISTDAIALQNTTELTESLHEALISYLKQELFVAIYAGSSKSPFTWAPKLRVKNIDQPNMQNITVRYFDSKLLLVSEMNLRCLTTPDVQNNIYRATDCEE